MKKNLFIALLVTACSSAPSKNDDGAGEGGGGGAAGAGGEPSSDTSTGGKATGGKGGSGGKGGTNGKGGSGGTSKSGDAGKGGTAAEGGSGGAGDAKGGSGGAGQVMSGGAGGEKVFPPQQAPVPPKDGLILHFNFDEGQGTEIKDQSGNGNHGVFVQGGPMEAPAHPMPPFTDGLWGKAIYPNKGKLTDEWVRVPSSDSINTTGTNNALTVAAWTKLDYYNSQWNMLVHRHISMMSSERFAIGVNQGVTLGYIQHGSAVGSAPVVPNRWIHIAMTYDGTTVNLYENGVHVGERLTDLGVQAGTEPITIASGINMKMDGERAGEVVHGSIDEVVMYNRALSADEIKQLAGL